MAGIDVAEADFAANLLQRSTALNPDASLIISPISIAVALSMVYVGAKGETKTQLAKILANDAPEDEIRKYFGEVSNSLSSKNVSYTLEGANKVYVGKKLKVEDSFRYAIIQTFKAYFESVDFSNAAATAKAINDFVKEKTHEKIKDIVNEGAIRGLRLFLINAIYFKGTWKTQFNPKKTEKKAFHFADSEGHVASPSVDTMHVKSKFFYGDDDQVQVVGLPYAGDELFMYIVLPKDRQGLSKLLSSLSGKQLREFIRMTKEREVEVFLPKFKIETSLELGKTLKDLGLNNVFENADFSGITTQEPIEVSSVLHKAFIEVNEEGTEAAAVTGVGIGIRPSATIKPPVFKADHPFLYAIIDNSARILFAGHVSRLP